MAERPDDLAIDEVVRRRLSDVSHDLRAPLAAILAAASTLEDSFEEMDAEARAQIIGVISQSVRRMAAQLDLLLRDEMES